MSETVKCDVCGSTGKPLLPQMGVRPLVWETTSSKDGPFDFDGEFAVTGVGRIYAIQPDEGSFLVGRLGDDPIWEKQSLTEARAVAEEDWRLLVTSSAIVSVEPDQADFAQHITSALVQPSALDRYAAERTEIVRQESAERMGVQREGSEELGQIVNPDRVNGAENPSEELTPVQPSGVVSDDLRVLIRSEIQRAWTCGWNESRGGGEPKRTNHLIACQDIAEGRITAALASLVSEGEGHWEVGPPPSPEEAARCRQKALELDKRAARRLVQGDVERETIEALATMFERGVLTEENSIQGDVPSVIRAQDSASLAMLRSLNNGEG
ncbi:hypothetical protein [Oceanicaulis sp.]|uniref:hypothetical protein n=1 Tax=Oceanicaulis sp. TaxID=1924941 RepID=UPI003D27B5B7